MLRRVREAVVKSVAKTGRLVIMDWEPKGSAACFIAIVVAEEGFGSFKKLVKLVCAPDTDVKRVCRVNKALCKRCGVCPGDVLSLSHYSNEQIITQMKAYFLHRAGENTECELQSQLAEVCNCG